jgi:hypothetical protein
MKRNVVFLVLLFAAASYSQVSIGATLQYNFNDNNNKDQSPTGTTTDASSMNLMIGPTMRFGLSPNSELVPRLAMHITSNSSNPGSSNTQEALDVGCGLYFYLLGNSIMKFSLGPDLAAETWFSSNQFSIDAGMPINIDFLFDPKWTLRFSDKAVDFGYGFSHIGNVVHNGFMVNIQSILMPSFTMFYTF